jgi:hypothetical protein
MFRQVRKLGLLLGAVCVFGALVAASASAAPLEYRTCVKAAKSGKLYTGKYVDKACTEEASAKQIEEGKANKYESQVAAEEVPFTGKGKAMTLVAAGKTVICKKTTSAGELTTERFTKDSFKFEKCGVNGSTKALCNSPSAAAGTIQTPLLSTGVVFTNPGETELGVIVTRTGGPIMEVQCGAETIAVKGRLIGSLANNKKGTVYTFATSGGKQALQSFDFEEEEFGPFTLFTENESKEQTEATLTLTSEQGPKGVYAI